jgi:alpha-L-fucosidase
MWIGAYFSKPDWHSDYYWWKQFPPADRNCNYQIDKYPAQWKKFVDYTHGQINELVSDYGKLDILWLDGGWVRKTSDEEVKNTLLEKYEGVRWARNPQNQDIDMPRLVKEVRMKQPKLIVVDRAVPGEQQNYLTPEQHIPDNGLPYPWETCMTMAGSWSYVPNDIYKPTNELIEKLVDIVSKGGNYLLNIGPSPEGEFSDTAYARLKEIGDWMKINSEAIYGTRMYSVFGEGDNIRFTQTKDGKTKYIFLFNFPDQHLLLTKIAIDKRQKLSMLGSSKKINYVQGVNGLEIYLPKELKTTSNHVWVLKISDPS